MNGKRCFVVIAFSLCAHGLRGEGVTLEQILGRAQIFVERKDFAAAEAVARTGVQRYPRSRDARSMLAWTTLWNGEYDAARALFRELLAAKHDDAGARLGLAQAEYWGGDPRAAARDFAEVLRLDPGNADARRALAEFRAAMQPGFALTAAGISDDQPYRSAATAATVYGFVDPVTKWLVTAEVMKFDSDLRDADAIALGAGGETTLDRFTLRANARLLRFPDATRQFLPRLEVLRPVGSATLAMVAERRELLRAAPALTTHPSASAFALRWSRERDAGIQFAVHAERLRYFDDNSGTGADAYVLFPVRGLSFGASAAYRDTDQSRFNGVAYDPYYTPQDLREVRLIGAARRRVPHATLDVHLDAGAARDRLDAVTRTFHPWRASIGASVPFGHGLTFSVRGEHNVTVYYTANELQTSVAGRF